MTGCFRAGWGRRRRHHGSCLGPIGEAAPIYAIKPPKGIGTGT
jgi:hypothetical protein